ncbi:MAG: sugar transferase, partial [Chloroflexi bacterium]|nr:sugar transferase [Chloroflexota bacterium]
MKRAFDIVFAAVALLVFSPLLAVIAIIVRVESPGPVFFRQRRVGMGEKPFQVL